MVHFLYSLITFFVALFFIALGVFGILVQSSDIIRSEVIGFIIEDTLFLSLFGFISIVVGIAIIFYLVSTFKKRYFKIKSKSNNAYFLDENIFQDCLKDYWKRLFPKQEIPNQVIIKKNKIQVIADLPYVPVEQQKELVTQIDRDLKDLFTKLLGYYQDYTISISFKSEADQ